MPDILSRPVVLPQTRENICTALIGQLTFYMSISDKMVPRAGIEPALLSEPDFESGASTNSANGAQ